MTWVFQSIGIWVVCFGLGYAFGCFAGWLVNRGRPIGRAIWHGLLEAWSFIRWGR